MSKPVTIVLACAEADSEMTAGIRELLPERISSGACRPVQCLRIHGLDPERLGARLSLAGADLAILALDPPSKTLDDVCLSAVTSASLECPVLVAGSALTPEDFLELLQAGASDFVSTPVRAADLLARVARALQSREPHVSAVNRLGRLRASCQIVGRSPSLLAQLDRLPLVASCDVNVLISGETGTGKDLFARAIHYLSNRSAGPFVAVNCGAIPAELVENELFGHEAGAYTTAVKAQNGLLREASGGSLFLDEIDTLTPALQVKLLRFLQDKEYRPLGTSKPRHADVRIIAASNISLEEAMRTGCFRQDLYYRLSVLSLELPSLRERPEDILLLARHFLGKYATELKRPARKFAPGAIEGLLTQPWRGNVRELENVIQRAVLLCDAATVEHQHLGLLARPRESGETSFKYLKARAVSQFERQYLIELLHEHDDNITAAARAAGKNRRAFWELLRKHHLLPSHPAAVAAAEHLSPAAPDRSSFHRHACPADPDP